MKWEAEYKHPKGMRFEIELDELAGYYLYAYDKTGFNFFDDLQDTLEWTQKAALREFGVPLDAWHRVE
ncbi:MAG: hypothetical protein H6908_06500 [Hyphomicrobiales bacterium]|nr:hypothetical protein [Hyphomicrobiales bacterium]